MKQLLLAAVIVFMAVSCKDNKAKEWPAKEQSDFKESCIANARNGIGEEKAVLYCNCMLEKIMKKYPDIKDAENIKMGETIELANECAKEPGLAPNLPGVDSAGNEGKKAPSN